MGLAFAARLGQVSRKFLIVTADDFGLDPAVNEAVRRATLSGILTATSLMVAAPAAEDAVQTARSVPGLRVGLHLVLADGPAVLPPRLIPDLVDTNGRFPEDMLRNSLRFATSAAVRAQLAAEIRAQFEAFARTGLALDHVNAHKHFHLHPTVLKLVLRIGGEFGARAVRVPREPLWFASRAGGAGSAAGAACLVPWLANMRRRIRSSGMLCNDQVFGIACSGRLDRNTMLAILAQLPPGITEIYLHPAVATAGPITPTMATYRHSEELQALLDPAVLEARRASQALCGGYSDLRGVLEAADHPTA
jgi:hopanoid biosynthesis associated protein HpnK